ncbi:hypothetical protein CRUP_033704 [Coryphaenoides rupestris]|nr:hypothetical protein CRUP_033704 [Coryphaenoides rupestris]
MRSLAIFKGRRCCSGNVEKSVGTVVGLYGETVLVPCNDGAPPPADLMFVKWKYAGSGYANRVAIAPNSSLLISGVSLQDKGVFTCMVVSPTNLLEYPVSVEIYSEFKRTSVG